MSYDNICKFLAEQYPAEFVRWLLNPDPETDPEAVQLLKTELSQEPIRADAIAFLQTANQILHLEFQTSPSSKPPLPFRMLDYSVRLKREYDTDVEQVVVFLKQTTSEEVMIEEYRDRTTVHRYRVLRLWEQDPAVFWSTPALLPFATLAQTDSPPQLLQAIAGRVARIEDDRQRGNVASCVEILAGLRFEKELIQQLFREDIMQESVIYQDILQQGQQQGLQQGEVRVVLRQLRRQLGEIPTSVEEEIRGLALEPLGELAEALLDFGQLADLQAWLAAI
jgi:predicted transposase/invertase (TIGR01784 family)